MSLIGNMIGNVIPLPYRILAGVLLAGALFGGTYWYAYHRAATITSAAYELKLAKFAADNQKIAKDLADEKTLVRENTIIRYLYKIQEVEKQKIVYVNAAINDVPAQNQLSNGWIYLHDQAAQGLPADDNLAKDPTPSGVMDNQALAVVTDNYGTCREKDEQITALRDYIHTMQDWATKVKAAIDKANKSVMTK